MTELKSYLKTVLGRFNLCSFTALVLFVMLSLTVASAIRPMDGEKELYGNIIRLHVLANSDSDDDQALKLLVRDRVTEFTSELLENAKNIAQAKEILSENADNINAIAKEVIAENGYLYDAATAISYEIYPERHYGKYRFPAGKYCSLRIKIGRAEGKNWWCVLFPPMCLGSATVQKYNDSKSLADLGFSESEIKVIDESTSIKKEIRFFFLDKLYNRK